MGLKGKVIPDITTDVDVILLVGSNPEEAHPVIGIQIRQAVMRGTRLIVVDPRKIALSEKADLRLMLKPGTKCGLRERHDQYHHFRGAGG